MPDMQPPNNPGSDKSKTVRIPLMPKVGGPTTPPPTLPPLNVATNSPQFGGHVLFLVKPPGEKISISASDIEIISAGGVQAVSSPSVLGHLVRVSGATKEIKEGDPIGGCLRGAEKMLIQGKSRERIQLHAKTPTILLFADTGDVAEVRLVNQSLFSSVIDAGLRIAPATAAPDKAASSVPTVRRAPIPIKVPVPGVKAAPAPVAVPSVGVRREVEPRPAPEPRITTPTTRFKFNLTDALLYAAATTSLAAGSTMLSLINAGAGSKGMLIAAAVVALGGVVHWGVSRAGLRPTAELTR